MHRIRLSAAQCKVRQCSQCKGNTEFYCNKCKHELCLECKERHVIDLYTIYHDVVIHREKYEYIQEQEICLRYSERMYELFCNSCEFPACLKCIEHRKHEIQDIRTAYKTKRQRNKKLIQNIRSETLYNSCFLLAEIKSDMKVCHTKISNCQSEISAKAQRLKNLIDRVNRDVLNYMTNRLPTQKRKISKQLESIENYEYSLDQSAKRPVKFLLFMKKKYAPKDPPILIKHALLSMTVEINIEGVTKLLNEIKVIDTGKRQIRNECLLKLTTPSVLHKIVTVTGVSGAIQCSFVNSGLIWISDMYILVLTNTEGYRLHHQTDIKQFGYGVHTVNSTCDLIYIDRDDNINKLFKDNKTKSTLIKNTSSWRPKCVYSSPFSGDLLVGTSNTEKGKVTRYNDTGQHIQTIHYNNTGQELYNNPIYITENFNGDVIVSDYFDNGHGAVVVTEREGRHRFSYTGYPLGSKFAPRGICTDALFHILICDIISKTVHMIDMDGHFLTYIHALEQMIDGPLSLCYDNRTHFLWIGSWYHNRVCVDRHIERQKYLQ